MVFTDSDEMPVEKSHLAISLPSARISGASIFPLKQLGASLKLAAMRIGALIEIGKSSPLPVTGSPSFVAPRHVSEFAKC